MCDVLTMERPESSILVILGRLNMQKSLNLLIFLRLTKNTNYVNIKQ